MSDWAKQHLDNYKPPLTYSDPANIWPTARATDPATSREAAAELAPGNHALVAEIQTVVQMLGQATHEQIASHVEAGWPGRWTRGSITSACARANLEICGTTRNRRGRRVAIWRLIDA